MYCKTTLFFIFLLTQSVYGNPLIYFIVSSDCPHCHTLMKDINTNQKLMSLLASEYNIQVIDTIKSDVPRHLPFKGDVPTIVVTNKNKVIGDALHGAIPSNEIMTYLIHVKNYLKTNNKEVYYVY